MNELASPAPGLALLLLAALCVLPASADAQIHPDHGGKHAASWGDRSSTPSVSDLVPKMSDDEAYTERYSFSTDLDNGAHIGLDLTVSNLGWGDGHGAASVRVKWPGRKRYKFSEKVDEDDWTSRRGTLDLNIAKTRVTTRDGKSFRLRHTGEGVSFDITFSNRIPMWRPGRGELATDEGYYKFNLLAPRADVSGEITLDGKTFKVRGERSGYGEHVATNVAPYDLADRFSRFRDYDDDLFVIWREVTLSEDFGGKSLTWIVVGYKDQIVFSDTDATVRSARIRKDGASGYRFPMALQIDGKSGADQVSLVMKGTSFKRKDLLKSYGSAVKSIASAVTKPYQFGVKCDYQLKMTIGGSTATVSGKGRYVLDYIDQ